MKYSVLFFISLFAINICNAAVLPVFGADLAAKSKYVWRGLVFNDEYVLWPDIWINWYGFTLTGWGSIDLTDVKDKQFAITDLAFYLEYTHYLGPVSSTIGYVHYTYPGSAYGPASVATGEIYGKVGADVKFSEIGLNINYDIKEAKGFYISPGINKGFSFGSFVPTITFSLGYADKKHNLYYFGLEKAGLTDFNGSFIIKFTPPLPFGNFTTITGDINYTVVIDKDLSNIVKSYSTDKNFHFGLGLNFYFPAGGE